MTIGWGTTGRGSGIGAGAAAITFGAASSFLGVWEAMSATGSLGFSTHGWSGPSYPTCRWQNDNPGFALREQADPSAL